MPAPSPTTKPSRSLSKGRLACCGSSLRVESARMAANPPTDMRRDRGLGPAGDHHVGVAVLNHAHAIADGVRAGGAGRGGGRNRPLGAVPNADLSGRHVDDGGRNKEGRDLARAAVRAGCECSRSMISNPPMPEPMNTPTRSRSPASIFEAGLRHAPPAWPQEQSE